MFPGKIIFRILVPVSIILVLIATNPSCKKSEQQPSPEGRTFTSLQIDQNFRFETYHNIQVDIRIEGQEPGNYTLGIYDGNPGADGKLIASGSIEPNGIFDESIRIPVALKVVYLKLTHGNYSEFATADIKNQQLNYLFDHPTAFLKGNESLPDCLSGCHHTISGIQANVVIQNGETTCVTGTLNGIIHFIGGGTVRVCGTANITNITADPGSIGNIWITNTGTFSCPGFIQLPNSINFINYGNTTFTSYLQNTSGCFFQNVGTFSAQALSFSAGSKCMNHQGGVINLTQNFSTFSTGGGEMQNLGTMNIGGSFTIYQSGWFMNWCRIEVGGNFTNLGAVDFKGGSYLKVNGACEMETNTTNYFIPNGGLSAYIQTGSLAVKGSLMDLCFAPYYHLINISNLTILKSTATISGNLDICDANGIEINELTLPPSITFCVNHAGPNLPCSPGSAAPPPPPDTDGDGVPDASDEYPTDPTRAYNSYYPNSTDFVNFAYEDLWPGKGDYDFNDVVMATNYKIVTNASNQVVDLIAKFKLRAFGAFLDNGFGFCLSALPSTVASVTGSQLNGVVVLDPKGFEAGHTNQTVIILYDAINTHFNGSIENTIPWKPVVVTPQETITVHFSPPQTSIGSLPYNPFILIGRERGKEVHFPDKEPTQLVNPVYFGTCEDNSNPIIGRYYKTYLYHPWAIETPEVFDYPIEKADIVGVYLHFAAWAESSGALYPDWYEDLPGYRNAALIY